MNPDELDEEIKRGEFSYLSGGEGIWVIGGKAEEQGPKKIKSMDQEHLKNCIKMMNRQLENKGCWQAVKPPYREEIKVLVIEKIKELESYLKLI